LKRLFYVERFLYVFKTFRYGQGDTHQITRIIAL